MKTREELQREIAAERTAWHALLAEVGEARMEEPGPMGDWTFQDLTAHLVLWGDWLIARVEAGPSGGVPSPWPASLGAAEEIDDWGEVNAWMREQHRARPLVDVLTGMDRWFERLADLIATLPQDELIAPDPFGLGKPVVDLEFFGHFHQEHEASVRAWLQTRCSLPCGS
jgi:hypothetical protein